MSSPYLLTPDEAQPAADYVATYLRRRRYKVRVEVAIDDKAGYVTTLLATYQDLTVLVEAQRHPRLVKEFRDLVRRIAASRRNCQTYVATDAKGRMSAQLLSELKAEGIGLYVADSVGRVDALFEARNPALMVNTDPSLRYGSVANKQEIAALVDRFNAGDRKAALQEMVELVESQTDAVARKAARKGHLTVTEAQVAQMKWGDQINLLATPNRYSAGKPILINANQKADMDSFRAARNLLDHKVRSKKEGRKREQQFAERMIQGPRLFCELVAIHRTIH